MPAKKKTKKRVVRRTSKKENSYITMLFLGLILLCIIVVAVYIQKSKAQEQIRKSFIEINNSYNESFK